MGFFRRTARVEPEGRSPTKRRGPFRLFRIFRQSASSGPASSSPSDQTLIILGCDNAGKTTLIARIKNNKDLLDSTPTVGFSTNPAKYGSIPLTLFDVGGGKGIRGIWDSYYADVHAAVFVVDAADSSRFSEALPPHSPHPPIHILLHPASYPASQPPIASPTQRTHTYPAIQTPTHPLATSLSTPASPSCPPAPHHFIPASHLLYAGFATVSRPPPACLTHNPSLHYHPPLPAPWPYPSPYGPTPHSIPPHSIPTPPHPNPTLPHATPPSLTQPNLSPPAPTPHHTRTVTPPTRMSPSPSVLRRASYFMLPIGMRRSQGSPFSSLRTSKIFPTRWGLPSLPRR